jgi:hypothetical protein
MMRKYFLIATFLVGGSLAASAQKQPSASEKDNYTQVITKRAEKIVNVLGITDSSKFKKVQNIIVDQYRDLSTIHDTRNTKVKEIKAQETDKAKANAEVAAVDSSVAIKLNDLHIVYLSKLSAEISPAQVDQVKNAMTYNVMPLTYNAYLDELPNLSETQKTQIKAWLIEARERAIDAESSEKKHAWFGKYKGRINNYLSAQGYDMKKAGEEWQKRIKEREAQKG